MNNPLSTYRIQFNKDFTFKDFERAKDYFKKLGVHTIYASPIFEAVAGSTHGYDVCNPLIVSKEIGDEQQLLQISKWLKEQGMLWLQDIVPNHTAFHPKNKWLMDVLEKGDKSVFSAYFDTVFTCPVMGGRLMVPFLGKPLKEAVNHGEIQIKWSGERLVICCNGKNSYPLKPSSYSFFLEKLKLADLLKNLEILENTGSPGLYAEQWESVLSEIQKKFSQAVISTDLQNLLEAYNQNKNLVLQLVRDQNYELCYWEETNRRINYRRFFTVNGLICLNIQTEKVFEHHHQFIKKMIDEGVFNGLRIDHIDGLLEPQTYLKRLRNLAGEETYIVAEKILEQDEQFPSWWPIQGSTGYDFLGMVNNLFTQSASEKEFTEFYQKFSAPTSTAEEQLRKKQYILTQHMAGELENLYSYFVKLQLSEEDLDKENLKKALALFLVYMPVYRFYSESYPFSKAEQKALEQIFTEIKSKEIACKKEIEKLETIFLQTTDLQNNVKKKAIASFFKRCMQFSGPLMAKGVEDTLMYTNFRFIGHNEVGDHPAAFGITVDKFHALMQNRQKQSPLSLNATSTHDTKMGEDARARLNVLTALPAEWFEKVNHWQKLNSNKRQELGIHLHEEYFIYQCLLAHYPINGIGNDFEERLAAYLQKAFREGKQHSDWANVNSKFEESIATYVDYLLCPENDFFQDFKAYQQKIAFYGACNSLAQLGLKFTCPGIPDVYQGSELWDFSFVDPDNRRKVDYALRTEKLESLETANIEELMANYGSGDIKLWLTQQLLQVRNNATQVFTVGDYIPVKITGKYKDHIVAFIRKVQHQSFLVVSLLNPAFLVGNQFVDFYDLDFEDTKLHLAEHCNWFNLLQKNEGDGKELLLNSLSLKLPFAVLKLSDKNSRHAGVLMHLSSLSGAFGVGDLGPEAFRFVDFLKKAGQHYWQLLPLGPGASNQDLSPYSTLSSMATNPLYISPEVLVTDGYLTTEDLTALRENPTEKLDFKKATEIKSRLLKTAFTNYLDNGSKDEAFQNFITTEKDWLQDFSLFIVLKNKFGKHWYEWPDEFRYRNPDALQEILHQHKNEILEQQWYQYIFQKQWDALKNHCSRNNVHLIGDLPFYVNHNSADVWANPDLFSLKADGNINKMAGVPPDYFSADGQLWGMPVYSWPAHEKSGYKWWLGRLRKNLNWFNLLRLDHFRAFYNYWAVDANETTAINGEWILGPAERFLDTVKTQFPLMPFIAEDLGDISSDVFELRDKFRLPGMKVLQFAFGEDMPVSPHIPHHYRSNFVVYTGTHDNNTIKGWYKSLKETDKKRLNNYLAQNANEQNVAGLMVQMVLASVAKTAIIPVQDILNLDESSRMNNPGTASGNWSFRLLPGSLDDELAAELKKKANIYGRS